jgi:hypothetical protein
MHNIQLLPFTMDVEPLYEALSQPGVWDKYEQRRANPTSPHHGLHDAWFYYADPEQLKQIPVLEKFDYVWYDNPAKVWVQLFVEQLIDKIEEHVGEVLELGGVLATRIPAGNCCKVHNDAGYNAKEFSKYAIQVRGNKHQGFCFDDSILHSQTGEVFWFYNQHDHWVYNASYEERITLIVSLRTTRGVKAP